MARVRATLLLCILPVLISARGADESARIAGPGVAVGPAPLVWRPDQPAGRVALWLPGGHRELAVAHKAVHPDGDVTYFGKLAAGGAAAVTLGPAGGFARVQDGAMLWQIEIRDGASRVRRVAPGGFALAADDAGALGELAAPPRAPAAALALSQIDVLFLTDPDFDARYPGALRATRINHLVALANQAFVDSRIEAVLRVVGMDAVATPRYEAITAGNGQSNVDDLRLAAVGNFSDPAFVNVGTRRNQLGADLVTLLRVHDLFRRGACGVAYFPSGGNPDRGVNVVVDGEDGGSVCDELVLAHEVGHNLGAGHQLPDPGVEDRAHAFVRLGQFNTIMGSFGTGSADRFRRLPVFSNPSIQCGGMACGGSSSANNAATMNAFKAMVSAYRNQAVAGTVGAPASTAPDQDGDGVPDSLDAFPFDAAHDADADRDGVADALDAFPADDDEWADTDGGGQGDNADADDDNDGVDDESDAFPLDARESADADFDGVGDRADVFPQDATESRDADQDGIGDVADGDDDNDGVADFGAPAVLADHELLVMDRGTATLERFAADTGAGLGTLLGFAPGAVNYRSQLAMVGSDWLYFIVGSEVRRLDRQRGVDSQLVIAPFDYIGWRSGFPSALAAMDCGQVALAEMGGGRVGLLSPGAPATIFSTAVPGISLLAAQGAARLAAVGALSRNVAFFGQQQAPECGAQNYPMTAENLAFSTVTQLAEPLAVAAFPADPDAPVAPYDLYVAEADGRVVRLAGATGAALGTFVAAGSGGLGTPRCLAFGPDRHLYVCDATNGRILRFDGATGAPLGVAIDNGAAGVDDPVSIAFAPRVLDTDLPPLPAPPAPIAANTDPQGGGGGGAGLGFMWLALAWLARRRRA